MKNEVILGAAIEKVVENGYTNNWGRKVGIGKSLGTIKTEGFNLSEIFVEYERGVQLFNPTEFIFSPEFARAFFVPLYDEHDYSKEDEEFFWKYHQHEMLSEVQRGRCPIKYLKQFLIN